MFTTLSEAVIAPYETLLTLRGPSTPYDSLTTLSVSSLDVFTTHSWTLGIGPWALGLWRVELYYSLLLELYLVRTSESVLMTIQGFGIASDEVVSQMRCRKDLGGCGRTSEDVGPIMGAL